MKKIIVFLGALGLCACAHKTPTETVVNNHINHFNEILDYAANNMDDSPDVRYLRSELKSCVMTLEDTKEMHKSELATWKAKIDYWKLATFGLVSMVGLLIFLWLKKVFL